MEYLSKFWGTVEIPIINYEINSVPTWSENCVISNGATIQATTFAITDTKLYVPVVTFSTKDNEKPINQ